MSISSLLFTSRDSLLAHQAAIDITGANVANVNTPGYTRQQTILQSLGNVNIKDACTQIGVTVDRVERMYDSYIESQISDQSQKSSYSDTLLSGLQNIESVLDDTQGGGLSSQLNKFWSAWDNLSNNPTGTVERSTLVSAAESLTDMLASYKRDLDSITTDMNRNIENIVPEINSKAEEIRSLNEKILGTGGSDYGNANDLLDKRSQALKELSSLVNITRYENENGTINVYLSNGDSLVQGLTSQSLTVQTDVTGKSNIYSPFSSSESVNSTLTSGKLGAFMTMLDEIVPQYTDSLNGFATALSNRVNELHSAGYDTYKNTGVDFFQITDSNNASGTIHVNSALVNDVNRIAASLTVSGDGKNASKIAAIQNELLVNSKTSTLNNFIASMVGQIGNQVSNAETDADHQSVIMNQLDTQRETVSGVSIDEEMINLIKYQMGYNAAGKLCQTVNEMLDTLMGIIR
jgi:flagellar hook-associated protein 1 FlgK